MDIFYKVIKDNKPSVTLAEIKKYEAFKQEWENAKQNIFHKNNKPRMGF